MSTVPRATSVEQAEADGLRELLTAVHETLTVPVEACDTVDAMLELTRERTIAARVAIEGLTKMTPSDASAWLRRYVAQYAPIPAAVAGE